jgi:hypothetical protein
MQGDPGLVLGYWANSVFDRRRLFHLAPSRRPIISVILSRVVADALYNFGTHCTCRERKVRSATESLEPNVLSNHSRQAPRCTAGSIIEYFQNPDRCLLDVKLGTIQAIWGSGIVLTASGNLQIGWIAMVVSWPFPSTAAGSHIGFERFLSPAFSFRVDAGRVVVCSGPLASTSDLVVRHPRCDAGPMAGGPSPPLPRELDASECFWT